MHYFIFFLFLLLTQFAHADELTDFVKRRLPPLRHSGEQYFGGSAEAESERIVQWLQVLETLHKRASEARTWNEPGRPFHFEGGGVLLGRFHPALNLSSYNDIGLFATDRAPGDEMIVAIRFSNGVARQQHDLIPDVRGATIVFIKYNRDVPLEQQTIQMLSHPMTNGKGGNTLIGEDVDKFVTFAELMSRPGILAKIDLLSFLYKNPDGSVWTCRFSWIGPLLAQ